MRTYKRIIARHVISHGWSRPFPLAITLRIVEGTAPNIGRPVDVQLTDEELTWILSSLIAGEEWAKKVAAMVAERQRIQDAIASDDTKPYQRSRMSDPMFIAQRLREVVEDMG